MRKYLWVMILPVFLLAGAGSARGSGTAIRISDREPAIELLVHKDDSLTFRVTVGELIALDVDTKGGLFTRLVLPGFHSSRDTGKPALPMINRLIEIPLGADVAVEVRGFETTHIQLSEVGVVRRLMPAQPSVFKDQNPEELVFHFDEAAYGQDTDYDLGLARVVDIGWMRGVRLGRLEVAPVSYNPASGALTVRENIEISVTFTGSDRKADANLKAATYSPFFESVYRMVAGYKGTHEDHPDLLNGPVTYVIVSDPMFETQLAPFVQWQKERGFHVIEAYTDDPDVGSSTASIQSYLHDLYNGGTPEDPSPTFVLFVGDDSEIPAFSSGGHVTDLPYCDVTGDNIPEMYSGRFSARNSSELQPQIDKTLEYEKFEMPDPSYLGEAVMIAGYDGFYGDTHANGQINYATIHYFNEAHGILSNTYLYPASGGQASAIIQDVSDGCCYVNYTAHGSATSWSNPGFDMNDVSGLGNNHRYCFVVGNACMTASFGSPTCFGEHWLRVVDQGAIGYIGATDATLWDEDHYWSVGVGDVVGSGASYDETGLGAYDGLFHDHGEEFGEWYVTAAAHIFCGNLAVQESGSPRADYYWEVYHLMGDPALLPYFGVPDENDVTLPESIHPAATEVLVSAEPKSYVGISQGGEILGSGLVGPTGSAAIPISPPGGKGNVLVVATCQNKAPNLQEIPVTTETGECLSLSSGELGFGGVVQGTYPAKSTMLWNWCPVGQDWAVTDKPAWVDVDPSSGTLTPAPGAKSILVTANVDSLVVGSSLRGEVIFASDGGACSLHVSVDVRPAGLLAAPTAVSPADSVEVPDMAPVLTVRNDAPQEKENLWMHFEVDTTLAFSSSLWQLSDTVAVADTITQWPTGQLLDNTMWFWRAWAEDPYFSGDTSDVAVFYVNEANECPQPFSLEHPAHDSTMAVQQPAFSWQSSADPDPRDAVTYMLYLETGGTWDSLYVGGTPGVQWPDTLPDMAIYHWRVAAGDENGCRTWSAEWTFAIDVMSNCPRPFDLVRPANDSMIVVAQPLFDWESASDPGNPGSVTYMLFLAAEGVWDSVSVGTLTSALWPEALADNAIYNWKIAADGEGGCRIWSTEWTFAVNLENECPEPAVLLSPAADSTLTVRQPVFQWSPSSDPDPYDALEYIVFVEAGGVWDSMYAGPSTQVQWPDSLDDNSIYHWKIGVHDLDGCRIWSTEWAFAMNEENEPPGAALLVSPDSGSVSPDLRPTFSWSAVADPDPLDEVCYWIGFSQDSLFQDLAGGDSAWVGTATEFSPAEDLEDNAVYFWKVTARDRAGETTVSTVWKFAADTQPPVFTFVLFQNPFLERYLDFYAVPSESLSADPVVDLRWSDFEAIAPMDPLGTVAQIYHVDAQVPPEVCGWARVTGYDKAYVRGTDSLAFCSLVVEKGSPAKIASPDGRAELMFPEGAVGRDLFVTVVPRRAVDVPALTKHLDLDLYPEDLSWNLGTGGRRGIGGAFSFLPAREKLAADATLTFGYCREDLEGEPAWKLGIYRLEAEGWVLVEGSEWAGLSRVSASVRELGVYQLQMDPERTMPRPGSSALCANHPNPFNPSTTIGYRMASEARVTLNIYGVDGRLIRQLVHRIEPAGWHSVLWDGTDDRGLPVASGVYFCRMAGDGFADIHKLVLLK